jgi:hypothetical protein
LAGTVNSSISKSLSGLSIVERARPSATIVAIAFMMRSSAALFGRLKCRNAKSNFFGGGGALDVP